MAAAPSVNTEKKQIPVQEGVMRLVYLHAFPLSSISLAFILLGGCATHALRCDAHLTPINPPTATTDVKASKRGSP
jgi:hypothetical protein